MSLFRADEFAKIERDGVIFLDASVVLPGQKGDPAADFSQRRIPAARRFDVERFSDPQADLPQMLPTSASFARGMETLGIGTHDRIVFYDQKGSVGACRAWWMAKTFGHEHAAILDGGLRAWTARGCVLEEGPLRVSHPGAQASYRPYPRYDRVAGSGDVLASLRTKNSAILDARSSGRFHATLAEPRPGVRGGHIPGSISLPYARVLDETGSFLAPETLRTAFETLGIAGRDVITTCGSGMTAATLTVALAVAGLPMGRLYDGSWAEWGRDDSLPIATHDA